MPTYIYKCDACENEFKVRHAMAEVHENCIHCDSDNIIRVPSSFNSLSKPPERIKKTGDVTKEFIESAREDLNTQKEELDRKR